MPVDGAIISPITGLPRSGKSKEKAKIFQGQGILLQSSRKKKERLEKMIQELTNFRSRYTYHRG